MSYKTYSVLNVTISLNKKEKKKQNYKRLLLLSLKRTDDLDTKNNWKQNLHLKNKVDAFERKHVGHSVCSWWTCPHPRVSQLWGLQTEHLPPTSQGSSAWCCCCSSAPSLCCSGVYPDKKVRTRPTRWTPTTPMTLTTLTTSPWALTGRSSPKNLWGPRRRTELRFRGLCSRSVEERKELFFISSFLIHKTWEWFLTTSVGLN